MDLLEYQAKDLFRQVGIPVLPSQRIDHPTDLKRLKIPYPVVLKSQVATGARKKAGGIRFVENTIDAIAAAQTIFHLPILGQYPEVLLAETKYDADREFYLAVTLDSSTRRPLLLGSQQGGIEVEANLNQIRQVVVDQEFSPFYARRLAIKMGLQGALIPAVSAIVEKMYRLLVQWDLDLVEINPLAVSATGELMALDGKVTVNDAALGRQAHLAALATNRLNRDSVQSISTTPFCELNLVELGGNIGVLCNGAGLTMATLDLIHLAKGKPASFVDVGGEYGHCEPATNLQDRIIRGLDLITQDRHVKVVLVNLLDGVVSCLQMAEAIASYRKWQSQNRSLPPIVVRMAGEQLYSARGVLATMQIPVFDQLDEAIAQVIAIAKDKQPPSLMLVSA